MKKMKLFAAGRKYGELPVSNQLALSEGSSEIFIVKISI